MSPRSSSTGKGSKAKYTSKQQRMAEHIEKGYKKKGASTKKAERIAWATVNKTHGGGLKGGSATKRARKNARRPSATRRTKRS